MFKFFITPTSSPPSHSPIAKSHETKVLNHEVNSAALDHNEKLMVNYLNKIADPLIADLNRDVLTVLKDATQPENIWTHQFTGLDFFKNKSVQMGFITRPFNYGGQEKYYQLMQEGQNVALCTVEFNDLGSAKKIATIPNLNLHDINKKVIEAKSKIGAPPQQFTPIGTPIKKLMQF